MEVTSTLNRRDSSRPPADWKKKKEKSSGPAPRALEKELLQSPVPEAEAGPPRRSRRWMLDFPLSNRFSPSVSRKRMERKESSDGRDARR